MFKDNDFLQSDEWIRFQKSVGNRTHQISDGRFDLNIIEHVLPIAGRYFYVPRMGHSNDSTVSKLIDLAEKERTGWIRIDVPGEDDLKLIKKNIKNKIAKAPHDMQPREIFMIDISKSEEEILSDMKPKTRYNIRLASKKGVSIKKGKIYINDFLRLTKLTSERQGISAHPENYYRKMLEIPQVELYI
ncbi:MAG: peptidoglycan bridge formation glycyltransferase FemA/FemB family protein, partial [Candidatus Moranbacteria bacterium]|nr:peptidoglycan bridge formation glycyltransferase FemA/FemB family protein [Candidatus Moranbacteria bacterium]